MIMMMIMAMMATTIMVTIYNQGDYSDDNVDDHCVDDGNGDGDDYNVGGEDDDIQLRDWVFKFLFFSGGKYMSRVC